jgi:alkanesulfonate monooxygenase SsuD/methylene tetrahydromethanopterin reductase-like flavin-dependent oxidoreductase (luciferase family)
MLEMTRLAADVGFDIAWFADHLAFELPPDTHVRGVWDCWTTMAGIAAATERIAIGPLVACTGFRNPGVIAKMAEAIDEISGGRFVLGLGAGWHEPEYEMFGFPFDHRVGRFEEAIGIIVPMLREGRPTSTAVSPPPRDGQSAAGAAPGWGSDPRRHHRAPDAPPDGPLRRRLEHRLAQGSSAVPP